MKKSFRKHLLSGLVAAVVSFTMLASCSKSPDMGELIPDDVLGVISLDMGTLWDKADVDNIENLSFAKLGLQQLRSDDPQTAALVDAIIADPTATGLNLKKDIAVYMAADGDIKGAAMAVMHKRKKFEEFLTQFAKDNELAIKMEDRKGWRVATTESELAQRNVIVFNNKVAVMLFAEEMLDDFLELKHKGSLAANKNFRKYWKNRSEVSLWYNMKPIMDISKQSGKEVESVLKGIYSDEIWEELEHSSIAANLIFDKGAMRMEFTTQGISNKVFKTYQQKFNGDLADLMPAKTYATLAAAYNLKETTKILDINKDLDIDLDEEVVDGVTLRDAIAAFGGSMLIDLFDLQVVDGSVVPMMAVAFDIKDADIVRKLLASAELEVVEEDVFCLEGLFNFPIYVSLNKKALFVTNSESALEGFKSGKVKGAMAPVAKQVRGGNYFYADLDISHYPDGIRAMLPESLVSLMGKYLDFTEAKGDNRNGGEWSLYIKDKKQNSLLATLHFVDDNLVELGKLFDGIGGGSSCPVETEEFYVEDDYDLEDVVEEPYEED